LGKKELEVDSVGRLNNLSRINGVGINEITVCLSVSPVILAGFKLGKTAR
jgi:hypothetical protein